MVYERLNYYGHVVRAQGGMEKYSMNEKESGNRKKGRTRIYSCML